MIAIVTEFELPAREVALKLAVEKPLTLHCHGQPVTGYQFDRVILTCGYANLHPDYVQDVINHAKLGVMVEHIACCNRLDPVI